MKPLLLLSNISIDAKPKRELLDNVEHLVIPCIAIREGVLNNIFYSAAELESFATAWNGVPVPVNHPADVEGVHVTANSVIAEQNINIGRFYNVEWDSTLLALKGEIWLNVAKAIKLGYNDVIERLENGEVMEVSTGLYGSTTESKGTYNNVSYDYTISDIRPDHLALLPNSIGACSIKDGCGAMRTNTKKGIWNKVKSLFGFNANEQSFDQIREGIYQALRGELGDKKWPYILDVFDNYFVYENDGKNFRRSYSVDKDNVIILVGENIEVRLERKYVPVSAEININENKMKPKKKEAIVNALALALAVTATVFANHSDEQLEDGAKKLNLNFDDEGNEVKANCGCKGKPETVIPNTIVPINNGLSDAEKATLARLQANEDKRLDKKRESVLTHNKNLTKEIVATFNEDALDAMLSGVEMPNGETNFAVNGAQPAGSKEYKAPSVVLGD